MSNPLGAKLNRMGLYRPLKRTIRHLTDAQHRQKERELREDLEQTQREVGNWAGQGMEKADPKRLFAILSFTNLPLHAKFHCAVGKALQLRGYTPVFFTYSGCRFAHEYFRLFGFERLVMWDKYVAEAAPDANIIERQVAELLPTAPTVTQVKNLQFHGVDVGKHALSMTCRRRIEGRLDLQDAETFALLCQQLAETLRGVLGAEKFLQENSVEKMLVRDAGYIPNGAIYETALAQEVDCVVYEQGQRRGTWILKRYTPQTKGDHYFSLALPTWEQIRQQPWTPDDDVRLEQEFTGRYQPDSTDDTRRLQSGKQIKTPAEVQTQLGLDPMKQTAVIFSHVAWDAAFFFGSGLFEDFEDWLFQTVKFVAEECPQMNWIVKLHPFNVFKLQREGKTEESEMRLLKTLMPLPDHVRIMRADTDINTQSLFPLVDYVLTVNGTVGMEFPCFGIPAVLAGTGRYNGRGFTIEPPTQAEYFATLKTLHTLPKLDAETRRLARQHFYTLTVGRQTDLDAILPMELKRLNEAQSDVHDNIHFQARSLEEFQKSPELERLGDWLHYSQEPDLLEMPL